MRRSVLSLGKKTIKRLLGKQDRYDLAEALHEHKEYLEAYSLNTDRRVEEDPYAGVGGMWDEIGTLQFEFLVKNGLQPYCRMLDIGCGTLRGGRHFIRYLDTGNYSGMDISTRAIEYGKQLVRDEDLASKRPRLLVNENKDLKFEQFEGETFDYLLAQSVFTHLPPEHIEECFRHIGKIMKAESVFFFTFKGTQFARVGLEDFRYPFSFFQTLADRYGFRLGELSADYMHPRGQRMVKLTRA